MTNYEKSKKLAAMMTIEEKCSQLKYDSPAIERLGIPAFNWWNEGLHGVARAGTATVFPQAIGLAATFDTALIESVGEAIANEARAKYNVLSALGDRDIYKGLTLWSPNVNIFRDPRWGRGHETYGEDPFLTAVLGCRFVRGIQGNSSDGTMKAAACAKHFAVHSGPENLRHSFDATVGEKDLHETYLPAFEALVKDGEVAGVMGAYNRVNGEPACASKRLSDILREEWGFKGYFVSDCWAISDFHLHHKVTATAPESAALALKNGCDLNCGNTYLHIMTALEEGLICENDIDRAVERLLEIRFRLGTIGEGISEYDKIGYDVIDCEKHRELNDECARRSIVLLKNNGVLPLKTSEIKSVAVIGPNADSRSALIGNYHGTSSEYITLLDGIRREVGEKIRIYYAEGCNLSKNKTEDLAQPYDRISEAIAASDAADAVILCVGLDETLEGEEGDAGNSYSSGDKENLFLPEPQRRLIAAMKATGKPLVIAVSAGSSINVDCDCDALVHLWYSGARGGKAFADILFGNVSPSGKLPVTFYKNADELPDFCDYSMKNRTYRYVENEKNVLFPFGYGLTYGNICVASVECFAEQDGICAEISAENRSDSATDDVIQLYVKIKSVDAPQNASLCGFSRISFSKNEKRKIKIHVPARAFSVVSEDGTRYFDKNAKYILSAGIGQPDTLTEKLTGRSVYESDITSLVKSFAAEAK